MSRASIVENNNLKHNDEPLNPLIKRDLTVVLIVVLTKDFYSVFLVPEGGSLVSETHLSLFVEIVLKVSEDKRFAGKVVHSSLFELKHLPRFERAFILGSQIFSNEILTLLEDSVAVVFVSRPVFSQKSVIPL